MTKEECVEWLMTELKSVYCWNCLGNDEDDARYQEDFCEDCYRKQMGWAIRRCTAENIVDMIKESVTE